MLERREAAEAGNDERRHHRNSCRRHGTPHDLRPESTQDAPALLDEASRRPGRRTRLGSTSTVCNG